jgi:hypothetical protein
MYPLTLAQETALTALRTHARRPEPLATPSLLPGLALASPDNSTFSQGDPITHARDSQTSDRSPVAHSNPRMSLAGRAGNGKRNPGALLPTDRIDGFDGTVRTGGERISDSEASLPQGNFRDGGWTLPSVPPRQLKEPARVPPIRHRRRRNHHSKTRHSRKRGEGGLPSPLLFLSPSSSSPTVAVRGPHRIGSGRQGCSQS